MIKVSIKNLDKVVEFIKKVPLGMKTVTGRAVADYLVGDMSHGLKHYPPYKYVSWNSIGGFVSDKQRRYVMAKIRSGEIDPGYPHRTGNFQRGWYVGGEPPRYVIKNEISYGNYLVDDNEQSRMHSKIGWRTVSKNIADNMKGAIHAANLAIAKWINTHK